MAEAAHAGAPRGGMDIQDQKYTFHHFVVFCLWGTLQVIMIVALLTVAFAMGLGWFAGVAAYAAIGVAAGLFMRMSNSWWVLVIGTVVVLGAGGLVTLLFK
jgi:hypothetical protein